MSCEYCTDPDGAACFPIYGIGPHTHEGRDGRPDDLPANTRLDDTAPPNPTAPS